MKIEFEDFNLRNAWMELVNEYLEDFCAGKVNDSLIDYVDDLHEDIENKAQRK